MTVMESLVQVTVVAGPPVEIQVRVSWSESNVTSSSIIVMLPKKSEKWMNGCFCSNNYGAIKSCY